ncbi:hypothetical protein P280DRAFT_485344 [Massarina eburnea CBS 473.64]|uniref:FAD/NAD(P)-binding domain-containing protein n=1 Tax=Massarina eburnea CBS 473.64 TaxID=1395130 RepID=A0A6A6RH69_9PLEO|nr:hypothetical protein P280DRAFT_485344 [Massarina eburnea CBS 473.64]
MSETISADYLVIGAGAMGLAFVDTILSDTDKTVILVDRYARPGGHWTTAYPFVRLHQPSFAYGVNSRRLDRGTVDKVGWNKGLQELATRDEVTAYFEIVMRETFLPSGRVKYFPKHEYVAEGEFRSILTNKTYRYEIGDQSRIVDATYSKAVVPSMRPPPYDVAANVDLVTPNNLPGIKRAYANYTVVGAGKTAIDTALWMLANGIEPSSITWIMPRDSFFLTRESVQLGPEFAAQVGGAKKAEHEAILASSSVEECLKRQADEGLLPSFDSKVWPTMFHCASVSAIELNAARGIKNIIRKGRVIKITAGEVTLTKGSYQPVPDTLYIDCTANGLAKHPPVPVFQGRNIVLQPVRVCQQVFSAAFIAHAESTYNDEEEKNRLCNPIPMPDKPRDWFLTSLQTNLNWLEWAKHPKTMEWVSNSRLDFFGRLMPPVPEDPQGKAAYYAQFLGVAKAVSAKLKELLEKDPEKGANVSTELKGFPLESIS